MAHDTDEAANASGGSRNGRTAGERMVPVKISEPTQAAVKRYAILYDESQQRFIARAVRFYAAQNAAEIANREKKWMSERERIESKLMSEPV